MRFRWGPNPPNVEKIVFAAEHGTIWLSAEPADAPNDSTPVLTKENLYK
jgi:pilus assembly protein CpaB